MKTVQTGLNRSSLAKQISETLTNRIYDGIYRPGEKIPSEHQLADEFSVSRPVVREAIQSLSAHGFIEVMNGIGAVVQELNEKPLKIFFERALNSDFSAWMDMLEVRKTLEIRFCGEAAVMRSGNDLAVLRELVAAMSSPVTDFDSFSRLDIAFHLQIAEMSRNSLLRHLIVAMRDSLYLIMSGLGNRLNDQIIPVNQQVHTAIFQAIESGDRMAAERSMATHFNQLIAHMKQFTEESES